VCIEEVLTNDTVNYIDCKGDGVAFTLTVSNDTKFFRIRSLDGGSRIGRISLTGSRSSNAMFGLLIARGVESFEDFTAEDLLNPAGTHWGGLVYNETLSPLLRLAVAVSGSVPGTVEPPTGQTEIGNIHAGKIFRLQAGIPTAGGVISGEVKTWANLSLQSETSIDHVQINELADTAIIHATTGGRLIRLMCGYGSAPGAGLLSGNIDVGAGGIDNVLVYGPIGSATDFATIEAREGILSIIAFPNGDNEPQAVYANIDANTADQPYPPFSELRCGAFTGSLHAGMGDDANVSMPEIAIDGDLTGPLSFEGDLKIPIRVAGECLSGSSINIGGSVWASITSDGDLADILIEGDILSHNGDPDIHIRSDTGRVNEIKVYGNIVSDDADGSGLNIFLEAAEGFGWIEAKSIVAFIGSPDGPDNFVPIDHLSSVPSGTISEFDAAVWCSAFETFDVENPVGNLVQLGHTINFLEVPAGARARFAGVATTPPGFDGTIRIHEADGLKGQMIFNADAVPNLDWENFDGDVQILGATQLETLAMPGYTRSASTFGGGASGLVPFLLHGQDCAPPVPAEGIPTLCAGGFRNGTAVITLTFKGPVAFEGQNPVTIEMFGGNPGSWMAVASANFRVQVNEGNHRQIEIDALPSDYPWTPADYRIKPVATGSDRLRCDELFDTDGPSVADFTYTIHLNGECGGAGCNETRCECPGFCFFSDFNQDGGVDGADVTAFTQDWENGLSSADVDLSGGVDGADVEAFYCLWELGGC
jgi:hypothetical protein